MNTNYQTYGRPESLFRSGARQLLGNRFALLAIAALVLGLGAYSNWGWLVAAGIAPILLSVAPCAAMCALGLCAMGGKKSPSQTDVTSVSHTIIEGQVIPSPTPTPLTLEGSAQAQQGTNAKPNQQHKGCC